MGVYEYAKRIHYDKKSNGDRWIQRGLLKRRKCSRSSVKGEGREGEVSEHVKGWNS